MKTLYVLLLILTLAASGCDLENTPPVNISQLEGRYKTNGFLDPLCIAISDENQLPSLDISKQSNGEFKLTRTTFIPQKDVQTLLGVRAEMASDTVKLYYQNQALGTYTTTKWFNGKKEVQSPVLRVSWSNQQTQEYFYFAGVKR